MYAHTCIRTPTGAPGLDVTDGPFELTSFALSLLLVFRTDSSYARWNEALGVWTEGVCVCACVCVCVCMCVRCVKRCGWGGVKSTPGHRAHAHPLHLMGWRAGASVADQAYYSACRWPCSVGQGGHSRVGRAPCDPRTDSLRDCSMSAIRAQGWS